jgi:DNA-binding MarR family transcriptional regulator
MRCSPPGSSSSPHGNGAPSRPPRAAYSHSASDGRRLPLQAQYGSVLIPLLEEDGLRMGEIARRARLSKQTMTTMVRLCERDGLVERRPDPDDGRATLVHLTAKARRFQPAAERVLARLERQAMGTLGERRLAELRRSLRDLGPA